MKCAQFRTWFEPSSLINIKIYGNLREMCEDVPSRCLAACWDVPARLPGDAQAPPGASGPPPSRILPASYIQKSGAQEAMVSELCFAWVEPGQLPNAHLSGF